MNTTRLSTLAAVVASAALLSACVVAPPRERVVYAPQPAPRQVPAYAEYGRVENIGYVQVAQRTTGGGALLGAVIGGVVGNRFGAGTGRALATGAGAIGGAVVGNAIEGGRQRRDDEVYRVQVRFDSGAVREFDFQRIDDLRIGDRVKLEGGQIYLQ
ncbi:MAG TPA: glycine zipper 2TM domain-containing protein [Burkholderiaceae bacterium]|nr:glycine zipper 2TM domain-containing protein [Burkholderiaceae bacterium]